MKRVVLPMYQLELFETPSQPDQVQGGLTQAVEGVSVDTPRGHEARVVGDDEVVI